jgi:DNA processing protein
MFHFQAQDLIHYLAICHIPQMSSKKLGRLFGQFDSFDAIFGSTPERLIELGFSQELAFLILKPDYRLAKQDLDWHAQAADQQIITWFDAQYPQQLRQIASNPPILYTKGNAALLSSPQMAIVGSRNPSASGLMNAQSFSTQLALFGYTITSGLALGIDAKAHQAALLTSRPTIAVLGTGLNNIYPKCHQRLAQEILEQGLLVSEFPVNTQAKPEHFPRRNRIISGLSVGVLVVEAALKSGSLITARYALEQNREVFAIPGAIHNPLAQGCHSLLRQGAKLVETLADIVEELPDLALHAQNIKTITTLSLSANEQQLLSLLHHTPIPFEYLVEQTGLATQTLTAALTQLEIGGLIQETPCGYIYLLEQRNETQCA